MLDLQLPPPRQGKAVSVFTALERRETIRRFRPEPLPIALLSDLLWSACGVNRPAGPFGQVGRTAASASNSQEVDLYVALQEGTYLYHAPSHLLAAVSPGDLRARGLTPGQKGVDASAPVQLIYVADVDRLIHTQGFHESGLLDPEMQKAYYYVDTGLIAQNVYLFAAAEGLGAWFHNCDRVGLAKDLRLGPQQRVLFAQSVGFASDT